MISAPPKIELLPEHLIDQIKAGEVIERPGNLLKEILENAVDAGATKLELILKNNGLDLISLKDNGHGMSFKDLPLAFSRHATSKITRFEDLYRLHSFGFRGEALASIASIAKLQCISFTLDQTEGSEIRIHGGETTFHGKRQTSGFSHGTELVIQELFYNTPVRLKFIQSKNSEKQFIKKIIQAFILSNPKIEFQIKIDDEDKEIYPTCENTLARIKEILPKAKDQILHAERFYEDNELELYLVPGHFKAPLKWQYVFINNRIVLDKQFHRVLLNALQLNFAQDDFHYLAFLSLPPQNMDVNVHPNKTIIKCLESSKLIALLTSTIRELSQGKRHSLAPSDNSSVNHVNNFLPELEHTSTLSQERHGYNMEGLFSPHGITHQQGSTIQWIANEYFLLQHEGRHFAYGATKLLEKFTYFRLNQSSVTIPLLVSEPYPIKGVKPERVESLIKSGLELEKLGPETLVLRGIPEWMNGFPLKNIIQCLLQNESFNSQKINIQEWSSSTWEEMVQYFPIDELIESKIAVDLAALLREKIK